MRHPSLRSRATGHALLAAALTACASAGPGPLVPGPDRARATLSGSEVRAIAEVLMLEDHRRFERDAFDRLLGSESVEVRRRAVTAAGRIGDRAAVPLLVRALGDDLEPAVRADAAFALGELGDTSVAVVRALDAAAPPSWVPVRDPEIAVVVEVLGALGKLGTADAARHVAAALLETHPSRDEKTGRVAAEALLASWRFGAATPVPRIATFLTSGNDDVRWRAAYALMRSGRSEGVPYLLGRFDDPDHRVRAYAARGLARRGAEEAGVADSALVLLTAALDDEHPHVRINAAGALGSYGERVPVQALEQRILLDANRGNVAVALVQAMARAGGAAAEPLRAVATRPGLHPSVRGAALAELAAHDAAAAGDIGVAMAGEGPRERWHVARALTPMGWPAARALLEELARDTDPRIAIAALEAAGALASDSTLATAARDPLRRLLLDGISGADPRVATVALAGLAPLATPDDRGALMDAFARHAAAATPADRAAAIAAIRALGALAARDAGAPAAFFGRFQPPSDRWLRRAAADTLGPGWGAAPAAVAGEDLALYEEAVRRYVAPFVGGEDRPVAIIRTASGTFDVELLPDEAPLTVANFVGLADAGYFDDGVWHRVVPNFVLQDGAPGGFASGGPGWSIRDEINRVRYTRGVLGMALAGPDTGGSQWFITHSPQPHLDGGYTVFGRVSRGMEVADRVTQGEPILEIRVRP